MNNEPIYFLVWCCPWPGYSGADLRAQGLLVEASKGFDIDLVVFSCSRMSYDQRAKCLEYCRTVTEVPLRIQSLLQRTSAFASAIMHLVPYHASAVSLSVKKHPIKEPLKITKRVVVCAPPHSVILAKNNATAGNWILCQYDADVEFWRIKAREESYPIRKLGALVNLLLSSRFYKKAYDTVGCIISVCDEDRQLTMSLSKDTRVEIFENGVDCSYFKPNPRVNTTTTKKLLFTGTSTQRNMNALRYFLKDILPSVRDAVPDVEFVVAGEFTRKAQEDLKKLGAVHFTGKMEDIRSVYDECDVFVCPFKEKCYGSKLKISQALSMGICVITTLNGARGFPLLDDDTALIADTDEKFIRDIIIALGDPDLRHRIGTSGRQLALRYLDWPVIGSRIRNIIADLQG